MKAFEGQRYFLHVFFLLPSYVLVCRVMPAFILEMKALQ